MAKSPRKNKTDREKIAARIKALNAKTQDRGCTEVEALPERVREWEDAHAR